MAARAPDSSRITTGVARLPASASQWAARGRGHWACWVYASSRDGTELFVVADGQELAAPSSITLPHATSPPDHGRDIVSQSVGRSGVCVRGSRRADDKARTAAGTPDHVTWPGAPPESCRRSPTPPRGCHGQRAASREDPAELTVGLIETSSAFSLAG